MRRYATILLLAGAVAAAAGAARAKELGKFTDWAAHSDGEAGSLTCWMYSEPEKDEGKYTRRGRIYVLVTHQPAEKTVDQVQITAGYAYKQGSDVDVTIDKNSFSLFTNADSAWARDAKADAALVAAMRAGNKMVVVGTSSRGTKTTDTYSLAGFSAAHDAISKACGVK